MAGPVIRNAVIHIANEQPLLADLYDMPAATDVGLVCTNLRTLGGKRPVFVGASDSVFVFPFVHIRFVEIPSRSGSELVPVDSEAVPAARPEPSEPEAELELDEDFLRRVREA